MLLVDLSSWPDVEQMLVSFANNIPTLERLIQACAYIIGISYMFRAVYQLKEYGELRAMMSMQTDLRRPMIMFAVAVCLLYSPTLYNVGLQTIFAQSSPSPLAYVQSDLASWSGLESIVVRVIQLIGLIAFIRGVMILATLASPQHPPGTLGKALTHIIGGILAINIVGTAIVIQNTFGFLTNGY